MSTLIARLCLPLLLLTLTGCLQAPPAQESKHTRSLERWFPDPGAQALAVAAELGDAAEVRRLMKDQGVDPDKYFSSEGMPLVAWPIYTKNPAGLKAMLENGADPNAAKNYPLPPDRTPRNYDNALVRAAKEENSIYLKLLLDHGGNPDTRNVNNESLLFQAMIWQNQWQNVQLLVERGADVNARSTATTILHDYAVRSAFKQTYWLLQHGADPSLNYLSAPSERGRSLVIESIFWMPVKDQALQWQIKCQRWLLARNYERPPMPPLYKKKRADFGFPIEEKDIPLPDFNKETTL